ncbi:hypothetical protein PMAYCL1PPCAC_26867, partial [Pristionchus mayeri]
RLREWRREERRGSMTAEKELFVHILSFLPMEDRLRARVNKILYEIEAESKYHLDYLGIEEPPPDGRLFSLPTTSGKQPPRQESRRVSSTPPPP